MQNFPKLLLSFLLILIFLPARAQYFGRNKPQYEKKKIEVVETPHFRIYHYLKSPKALYNVADESEMWYGAHFDIFQDSLQGKNPVLVYNDHPDFQQTRAIGGSIGVGTGGVTDAFKQRIIFPFAMSNQQTHHVIGHEMVHAFQYNLVIYGDSTSLNNLGNLPLWMTEGLAEYMSIGRHDAHTAMWMREAVLNDDIPKLDKMDNPKYFPYRWGHAFWAFVTAKYGDDVIRPLYENTAKFGLEYAIPLTLTTSLDSLSDEWQAAIKSNFGEDIAGKKKHHYGKKILSEKNAGYMNIAPSLSPNGRYLVFLSEKELFSMDLYLADARSGKILRKLTSKVRDGHIDALNFMESSGAWSPHSNQFAYVIYAKGQNRLLIKEVKKGKTIKEVKLKGIPAFSNPTWSPDGKSIVVAGLVEGQIDLYQYHIKSGKITQLTNDKYDELLPTWSPDGTKIAFSSDQWSQENSLTHGKHTYNITILDVASGQKEVLPIFNTADNMNPVFNKDNDLLFLSNRDGFRNMYRYDLDSNKVFQMTDLAVGISGITPYAPTISVSRKRDRVIYNAFSDGKYFIKQGKMEKFMNQEVAIDDVNIQPAQLFEPIEDAEQIVDPNFVAFNQHIPLDTTELKSVKFKSKFKLDYLAGSGGVGVGTGNFGTSTGLAGGIQMLFSDILGRHQVTSIVALNGEILDFGGMATYVNQVNKTAWGVTLSHIPYRSGQYYQPAPDSLLFKGQTTPTPVVRYSLDIQRLFENRLGGFIFYPFSTVMRVEAGATLSKYGYRIDRYNTYTDYAGYKIFEDKKKLDAPKGFNLMSANTALVGDNSFFGATAPLKGYRYRLGIEQTMGAYQFANLTLDGRYYLRAKPVTFAFRGMHFGRYGRDHERLYPIYLGNPVLIRGFYNMNRSTLPRIVGSKVIVGNAEIRLPFTGPKRLALIPSKYLMTDLNLFFDSGVAYFNKEQFGQDYKDVNLDPLMLMSGGVSLRVNLFGALIVEPFYAFPIGGDLKDVRKGFGINFTPGW